jgi:hypothetical protein
MDKFTEKQQNNSTYNLILPSKFTYFPSLYISKKKYYSPSTLSLSLSQTPDFHTSPCGGKNTVILKK